MGSKNRILCPENARADQHNKATLDAFLAPCIDLLSYMARELHFSIQASRENSVSEYIVP